MVVRAADSALMAWYVVPSLMACEHVCCPSILPLPAPAQPSDACRKPCMFFKFSGLEATHNHRAISIDPWVTHAKQCPLGPEALSKAIICEAMSTSRCMVVNGYYVCIFNDPQATALKGKAGAFRSSLGFLQCCSPVMEAARCRHPGSHAGSAFDALDLPGPQPLPSTTRHQHR